MNIVDDPMLALITRFVVDIDHLQVSDQEFLHQQIASLKAFVAKQPVDQREQKALEWIEAHAKQYRQDWQKKVIPEKVSDQTCPDCPLISRDSTAHCEIHDYWIRLLQDYLADAISSRDYVQESLSLLKEHKSRLKVAFMRTE